jgi:hypothetical protein
MFSPSSKLVAFGGDALSFSANDLATLSAGAITTAGITTWTAGASRTKYVY